MKVLCFACFVYSSRLLGVLAWFIVVSRGFPSLLVPVSAIKWRLVVSIYLLWYLVGSSGF